MNGKIKMAGSLLLVLGLSGLGLAKKFSETNATVSGAHATIGHTGTLQSIKQVGNGYRIKLQDPAGVKKEFMASKNVEVRDIHLKKVPVSTVHTGTFATLNLEKGRVTKIFLNS